MTNNKIYVLSSDIFKNRIQCHVLNTIVEGSRIMQQKRVQSYEKSMPGHQRNTIQITIRAGVKLAWGRPGFRESVSPSHSKADGEMKFSR